METVMARGGSDRGNGGRWLLGTGAAMAAENHLRHNHHCCSRFLVLPLFFLWCAVEGRAEERKREDDENGNVV